MCDKKERTERGAEHPKTGVCCPLQSCAKPCCCLNPQQLGRDCNGCSEAGGIFMAPLLCPWVRRGGKHSQPHRVAAAWGGPFTTPFRSPSVKDRDTAALMLGGLAPSATGLFSTTATWYIYLGHMWLLGEGSPSTARSECQVLTYVLVRHKVLVAFIFLFSLGGACSNILEALA